MKADQDDRPSFSKEKDTIQINKEKNQHEM